MTRCPSRRSDALAIAFGLKVGTPPDRLFVGLAVLGLLSEAAADRPLLCVVDDAQWLDRESAQALAFATRRLMADSVGVILAAPVAGEDEALAGLPELRVEGLGEADAKALLASTLHVPIDKRVRDRILAETRGNPLALLELPRGMTPAELAGGFVISNCVINLSVDKPSVLTEMFRVLKSGGRIGSSDVVADDQLTRADRGSYVGCIAGALSRTEYLDGLAAAGFADVTVRFTQHAADGMHGAIIQATRPNKHSPAATMSRSKAGATVSTAAGSARP